MSQLGDTAAANLIAVGSNFSRPIAGTLCDKDEDFFVVNATVAPGNEITYHRRRMHTIARPPLQRPVLEAVRGSAPEVRHLQVGLRAELEIQELTERSRVMSWRIFCVAAVLAALGCGRTVPDDGCPDGVPPCSGAPPTCQNANIQL